MNSLRALAQLVRLPNLPTALADIALAALATRLLPQSWLVFLVVAAASCCLYLAGMAFNDFFDIEQDRRERPDRPLPSGRIGRATAGWLAGGMLVAGVLLATLSGGVLLGREDGVVTWQPGILAGLLACTILLYDAWLKHTALGPLAMGSCRFFNVLMGVSVSGSIAWPLGPFLAIVVGLYIVGVTWFARTEVRNSKQSMLAAAASVLLASLLLVPAAAVLEPGTGPGAAETRASPLFPYLLVGLGFWLGFPLVRAIRTPIPPNVQAAIKRSLMGLILLDTVLALATAGTIGLSVLLLLGPSLYLNRRRWLYAT